MIASSYYRCVGPCPIPQAAIDELVAALAPERVIWRLEDLSVFEYDGTIEHGRPQVVVLPESTAATQLRSPEPSRLPGD